MFHKPILVAKLLSFFEGSFVHLFVDGTVGAGGHSLALLEAHPEIEHLYGIDQDDLALEIAHKTLLPFQHKVTLLKGNFRDLSTLIPTHRVDGIFLDLGVSSMQLDRPEKGFSFSKEGPLDMRMDTDSSLTAAHIVNTYSEKELGEIFRVYGEEKRWRKAAKAIVWARQKRKIVTTFDLAHALAPVMGGYGKKIHPLTLIFQALRIVVNDELGAIEEVLPQAVSLLKGGGKMGVLTFHSLEDRIVKHTFRRLALEEKAINLLTKKPLIADREEIRENYRSRSAKLRVVEKR